MNIIEIVEIVVIHFLALIGLIILFKEFTSFGETITKKILFGLLSIPFTFDFYAVAYIISYKLSEKLGYIEMYFSNFPVWLILFVIFQTAFILFVRSLKKN